jgi:4-diphosphocytidyl-2-C-methyl-D-erythritol kinase
MLYRDQTTVITVAAPAKLNLFLKVLGKRADGYHELETLMVSVGLYDTLRITADPSGALSLSCHDAGTLRPGAPPRELPPVDGGNLVLRAAELLRETTGVRHGAHIELVKRIPLAAGLAGGSSDAAAALAGLNRFWRLGLSSGELQSIAARLGSDIPFFLSSSAAAICRGRGEIIEPQPLPLRLHFVIARPRTGLATAHVFRNCRPSSIGWSASDLAGALSRGGLDRAARYFHNTLQESAERLNAEVTTLKRWFSRQPFAGHMMSGSGTSYFGLCRTRHQALQLASRLRAIRLGDVFVAQSRP